MKKKGTLIFNTLSVVLLACALLSTGYFGEHLAELYREARGLSAAPLSAISAIPLVCALLAAAVTRLSCRRWLQKQEPLWVVTQLVVAVILIGLPVLTWMREMRWDEVVPSPTSMWKGVMVIAPMVVVALATGLLINLMRSVAKVRRAIPSEERKPVSYGQLFAMCWLGFGALAVIWGFLIGTKDLSVDLSDIGILTVSISKFSLWFLGTVAVGAGCLYLIGLVWQRSKGVAILLGAFSFVMVVYTSQAFYIVVLPVLSWSEFSYADDREYTSAEVLALPYAKSQEDDLSEWWDTYGTMESPEEIYGELTETAVEAAARYAVEHADLNFISMYSFHPLMPWDPDYGDYSPAFVPEGPGLSEYQTLATFVFRRSCSLVLRRLFKRYRTILTTCLSREKYVDNGYQGTIELLIAAYDDLEGDGNKFREIYDYMSAQAEHADQFEFLKGYVSDTTLERFGYEFDEAIAAPNEAEYYHALEALWAYSFWGRRHNECRENPADIYGILTAVRAIYQ
jgi:hypothetical protein